MISKSVRTDQEIETIDRFLQHKGVALWANWDTTDDEERLEGATWLHRTIEELLAFVDHETQLEMEAAQ